MAVAIGGLLNLLDQIYNSVLIGFTLAGVALTVIHLNRKNGKWAWPSKIAALLSSQDSLYIWTRLALLCFILLFAFRLASTARVANYCSTDDQNLYLAVPEKMMETHHLAADPYSWRRIVSSVGGNYFVESLILCCLPLDNIQMADRAVGLWLLVLVSFALARQFEISPLATGLFAVLAICAPPINLNTTFNVLPTALILALVLVGAEKGYLTKSVKVQGLFIGLMAGTLCAIKTTYLPPAVFFCLAFYLLWGLRKGWGFALKGWLFAAIGALMVLVPWMIAMRVTSGTYLYPVFGPGYDFSAYHQFAAYVTTSPVKILWTGAINFVPLVLVIMAELFLFRRDEQWMATLAMSIAVLLGTLASGYATGEDSVRYNFPIVMPVYLLSFLQFSRAGYPVAGWRPNWILQAGSVAMLAMWLAWHAHRAQFSGMASDIMMSLNDAKLAPPQLQTEYEKIDSVLPKDGKILATLQHPYLLPHLDEHVLFADWPGCASRPPGWPIKKDGEALAAFLLSQSIRYLAFNYTDNVQLGESLHQSADTCPLLLIENQNYNLASKQYLQLKLTRRIIYDDGKVFILDLSSRTNPTPTVGS